MQLTAPFSIAVKNECSCAPTPPVWEQLYFVFNRALSGDARRRVFYSFLRRILKLFRNSAEIKYSVLIPYQQSVIDIA